MLQLLKREERQTLSFRNSCRYGEVPDRNCNSVVCLVSNWWPHSTQLPYSITFTDRRLLTDSGECTYSTSYKNCWRKLRRKIRVLCSGYVDAVYAISIKMDNLQSSWGKMDTPSALNCCGILPALLLWKAWQFQEQVHLNHKSTLSHIWIVRLVRKSSSPFH